MWLKSKSIPKVNSSIFKVFEPKFSIFVQQQYPSFSTSLQRNVATWGLWYANIFVDFFSHSNDQHLETFCFHLKSEFSPLVFFPVISRLKRFALIAIFLFFSTWFSMSWLFSHITIVKRRKNLLFILYAWRKQISVLICFFLFQKLIFLSFNWSSMRNSVWHCTDTNHFKQGQTIRMTVNEWHPHSVPNLRKKKSIQNLTHNCLLDMCSLKSRFFCEASICLSGLLLN